MSRLEAAPYTNEHQKDVVQELHKRKKKTAVSASSNSEIKVYLTRSILTDTDIEPYHVAHVKPLPDSSEFEACVTLRANWDEVGDYND
jgi:hypothetical protein